MRILGASHQQRAARAGLERLSTTGDAESFNSTERIHSAEPSGRIDYTLSGTGSAALATGSSS